MVNKTADLITNKTSKNANYMNSYRKDYSYYRSYSPTIVGGYAREDSRCGLAYLAFTTYLSNNYSYTGFVKCCIID